jgi:hypothetical protein
MACAVPLDEQTATDRRERRVVSVLFADLVGFTARSERIDVEDARMAGRERTAGMRRTERSGSGNSCEHEEQEDAVHREVEAIENFRLRFRQTAKIPREYPRIRPTFCHGVQRW